MKCYDCGTELIELSEDRRADGLASWQHSNIPALDCPAYAAFRSEAKHGAQPYKRAEGWETGADVWLPVHDDGIELDGHELHLLSYVPASNLNLVRSTIILQGLDKRSILAHEAVCDGKIVIGLHRDPESVRAFWLSTGATVPWIEDVIAHEYLHAVLDVIGELKANDRLDRISNGNVWSERQQIGGL